MQLLKAYKTKVAIEGVYKDATVAIEYEQDHVDLDNRYWSRELIRQTQLELENGVLEAYWVKVTVRFTDLDGFEGIDTLGQVLITVKQDYRKNQKQLLDTVLEHGMVLEAKIDLIKNVLSGVKSIQAFLKVG